MSGAIDSQYACWYRLDSLDGYLIWHSGAESSWDDGVYVDAEGRVPAFPTLAAVQAFAAEIGIALEPEEPLLHELDIVARWLDNPEPAAIDCVACLEAWNLFGDVARSVDAEFDPDIDETRVVYDKLFWGNNLPAMTPEGERFEPVWREEQARQIADVLSTGLAIFRDRVVMRSENGG